MTSDSHKNYPSDSPLDIEHVQTSVRIEKRTLNLLKALAENFDISLDDLLGGIVLHSFKGSSTFHEETLQCIATLKQVYDMGHDSNASHHLIEEYQQKTRMEFVCLRSSRMGMRLLQQN